MARKPNGDFPENVIRSDPEAFEDPLSNYDPPPYADELERTLCEGDVGELIQMTPFATVSPDDTIEHAVKVMADDDSFSLMVVEGGKPEGPLVGVLSERDVLEQVSERWDEVKDKPLRDVMTPEPSFVYANDPPAKVINLMATGNFRRVPVLDADDHVVGVVGPKRITGFLFEQIG